MSRLRTVLRNLHRDAGYLVVGLTFVYALSGIAVNHIADWDPNYHNFQESHEFQDLPKEAVQAQAFLERKLDLPKAESAYDDVPGELSLVYADRNLQVDLESGKVEVDGQQARFILKAINFLHLNRGKRAWTIIADGYAVLLLFLAFSGLLLVPGKKGLLGRGAYLVLLGIALPIAYVLLSPAG